MVHFFLLLHMHFKRISFWERNDFLYLERMTMERNDRIPVIGPVSACLMPYSRVSPPHRPNRSRNRNHKFDGVGAARIQTVLFPYDSAYDYVAYDRVKASLSEGKEPTNHNSNFQAP